MCFYMNFLLFPAFVTLFCKECPIPLVGNVAHLLHPKNRHEEVDINVDEVDQLSQDNSAIEAPLAGSEPHLADIRSDYSHSTVSKERPESQNSDQPREFFDPESTSLKKWSPSEPFRTYLEKNLKRRLTVDQVNEIIGENSLPETDACIALHLDKQILNYVPNSRRKGVENRDKDLNRTSFNALY